MQTTPRFVRIESGGTDGTFSMVLATSGEATDGHILSIRGGSVPDQIPLLMSHQNDPRSHLGSIVDARKGRDGDLDVLRATGRIEMGGSGPLADVRRDVAHMIATGHLTCVSLRWDPIRWTERTALAESHPAHVNGGEADPRKRWGVYFHEWRALEGSVVSIGADPAALIGRSRETTGAVAEFWRSMATATHADRPLDGVSIEEHEEVLAQLRLAEHRLASLAHRERSGTSPDARTHDDVEDIDVMRREIRSLVETLRDDVRAEVRRWARENLGAVI